MNRFLATGAAVYLGLMGISCLRAQDGAMPELTSIEKGLWAAWKNADPAPFESHLADDTVGVGVHGVSTGKQKAIEATLRGHPSAHRGRRRALSSFRSGESRTTSPSTSVNFVGARPGATFALTLSISSPWTSSATIAGRISVPL